MQYPEIIEKLINSYMKLPGIGKKTAIRLAFYTLNMNENDVRSFANSLILAKKNLHYCSICGNITENDPCIICSDISRNMDQIIVVENSKDLMSFEKINKYHGLYHVLHGVLSPINGKGPEDINITSLIRRLQNNEKISEVILATNTTPEGEATATYIARLVKPSGIKVTRLAHGLSVGSDIEYTDEMTLLKAIEGRTNI